MVYIHTVLKHKWFRLVSEWINNLIWVGTEETTPPVVRRGNVLLRVFPRETCRSNKGDFLPNAEELYSKRFTSQNAFTHIISTKITVHTPMSQEGIILFAWPVLCICSVLHLLTLLSLIHTQTHPSATEPLNLSPVTHFFCSAWQTRTCTERRQLWSHSVTIGSQCGVSLSCSFPLICNIKAAFII